MLAVELADDAFELSVRLIEVPSFNHRALPAVGDLDREAIRHAPLDARLKRVEVGRTVGFDGADGRELWIRPKQLTASHVCAVESRAGQETGKRIRHLLRQPVVRRIVPHRRRREILRRHGVQFARHRQVQSPGADVRQLDEQTRRQFALEAERPAMVDRVLDVTVVREAHALSHVCHQTKAGTDRLQQAIRERIGERADERLPVVERGRERRVTRESDLIDRHPVRTEHVVEHAVTAAHRGLRCDQPREASARHDVGQILVPRAIRTASVGIEQTATDGELAHGHFGNGIPRVVGLRRRRNWQRCFEVEAAHESVFGFRQRLFEFPPHTEIQRQVASYAPVVVRVEREHTAFLAIRRRPAHRPPGRESEQK